MPGIVEILGLAARVRGFGFDDLRWHGSVDGQPARVTDYGLKIQGTDAVEVRVVVEGPGGPLRLLGTFNPLTGDRDEESLLVNDHAAEAGVDLSADIDTHPLKNKLALEYRFHWTEGGMPHEVAVKGTRRLV